MMVRCDYCGLDSTLETAFHQERRRRRQPLRLCPSCWYNRQTNIYASALVISAAAMSLVLLMDYLSGNSLYVSISIASLLVFIPLATLLHEIGHAVGALLVGMRLFNICLGSFGRILCAPRVFGYDIVFRTVPLGGSTLVGLKSTRFARLRYFVMVACGPLVNVLCLAAALAIASKYRQNELLVGLMSAAILFNAALVVGVLWPANAWAGHTLLPSDGLQILTLAWKSKTTIEQMHAAWFYFEGLENWQRGRLEEAMHWLQWGISEYPDTWLNKSGLGIVLLDLNRIEEARQCFSEALDCTSLPPETEALFWNNLAWADLMVGSTDLRAEADRLSQQAFERTPWVPPITGTRGSVLVEIGNLDEGIKLLERALAKNHESSAKALNACYIALALAKKGLPLEAEERLRQARKLHPKCPLIARMEREIAGLQAVST